MKTRTGTRAAAALAICGALLVPGVALAADPTVETLPADSTLVTDSYALLSGTLNPNGTDVAYRFEWGRTASYGHTTPVTSAGNGKADELKPNTTYHYRLVVLNAAGKAWDGSDQQFTTTSALGLVFASLKAKVTKAGKAQVKVKSIGPPDEVASGRLTLKSANKVVGSVRYRLAVGEAKTLTVRLTKAGRAALAAGGTVKVVASAATSGVTKASTKTLKLEA
jgi:hypothetical protein